ncbi:D-3-phosphoglycerate dehydrogenase [Luminiphilus syltensis NOR5-1B]|uniref:D-3-phosphoglycerate dehydrogenase n=1 Tax=Luminiphilus syltensis NOR5-1B TaxID=565045 RepID=B8KWN7_9GAMM|nr:phosphoglycerate dehydrogenase [Luminiphilus syltensis]EED35237.1 D-3-phosphoglycerate dehydrogenase [Luminiphilus syltensis NOR5-1B]
MFRIQTYNAISVKGLDRFPRDCFEVGSDFGHPDAILLRSHKLGEDEILPSVKAIARAGAGVNNIPLESCTQRGIPVFNTPGANANAVKELVAAGMLLASRDVVGGIRFVNELSDTMPPADMGKLLEKEKKRFAGSEIRGKTLGVVGLGAIGSKVARMALHFGMEVIGYDPALSVEAAWRLPSDVQRMENMASLFGRADFISLHLPVLDSTRGLVNADVLAGVRQGTVLLNFAREEIVDTEGVVQALEEGTLGRFVTDFPHPSLLQRDDVILMPHIGASTAEAEENCAVMAADQLRAFLDHGNIRNSVNFPTIELERTQGCRIAITNLNEPGVLSHILTLLGDNEINVVDMLNKSRDSIAYNLIDIDTAPGVDLVQQLEQVEGVVNVRVIDPPACP